jgi:hypothetical protein
VNTTKQSSTATLVQTYLAGRKARGHDWTTLAQVSQAFGYDGAQAHIDQIMRKLLNDGLVQRRPYTGTAPRTKWEYALQ